jgi:hypothetical protein
MPDFGRAMIILTETSGVTFVSSRTMRSTVTCGIFFLLAACATSQNHIEPFRDVACFQRAQVSLAQAIHAAEQSEGKTVIDAEYNCAAELDCVRGNPGQYRITFFADGRLSRIGICPATGVVQAPVEKGAIRRMLDLDFVFDWPESEMLRAGPTVARAPVTMQAAIAAAEIAGGKAMAAHVKMDSDKARYVIELVDHSRVRIVTVDLQNGTVVQQERSQQ